MAEPILGLEEEWQGIRQFSQALGDSEYFHLWLEPVLTWGLAFGIVTFLFSLLIREQKTQVFALAVIVSCALLISTYIGHREAAEDRVVSTYRIDSPERAQGYTEQTLEWKDMRGMYWCTAALAAMGIILGAGKTLTGTALSSLASALAMWTVVTGWRIHYEESLHAHPNLRISQPAEPEQIVAEP